MPCVVGKQPNADQSACDNCADLDVDGEYWFSANGVSCEKCWDHSSGVWGGNQKLDDCGVCGGNNASDSEPPLHATASEQHGVTRTEQLHENAKRHIADGSDASNSHFENSELAKDKISVDDI